MAIFFFKEREYMWLLWEKHYHNFHLECILEEDAGEQDLKATHAEHNISNKCQLAASASKEKKNSDLEILLDHQK